MASSRHQPEMVADSSAATEEEEEDLGLDSMTAKGIQHLCSELLEINKASEQDFRANVYLSYLSFIRMFQEAGALEKDLHQHVLAHRRLVQHLSNNYLYSSSIALETAIPVAADDDHHHEEELELELELDVLLSEHRMEEALELLELQGPTLSASKARIADRFASVADNPRTPRPELLKALSGLCKLGDAQRANHLLFKFYRPAVDLLLKTKNNNYIKDLARLVFSSILEASRSFVSLHGHPSPYTPQLIRWAREEMEDFSVAFSEYVKSITASQSVVVLALEAARCAHSYCACLLRPLHVIGSEQDLLDLIAPCLQEVLTMYATHLKEVTRLFVASDTWVLGRFPVSGIILQTSPPPVDVDDAAGLLQQMEYCLLTASGRKFLTLIQDVVEDVYPLLHLRINNSVLQLVAELFREYMHSIVELIPPKRENEDHQYVWQLSILINCTTLVSLFPIIAHGVFKSDQPSVVTDFLTKGELDSLILLIKEAAGQVWTCFCHQFIRDTMSCLQLRSGQGVPSSPHGMMPSFPFQVLFGRVRQLNNLYGTILTAKDGAMKNLLQELMEEMISWLSNNLDSWIHHAQGIPKDTHFQQIQLDVHFLLEFAQVGGFSSENIRTNALDLLTKAKEKMAYCSEHDNSNSGACEGRDWAIDAAKHAVGVLMKISSSPHQEASVPDAQEEGEEMDQDIVESCQEGHMDACEDYEKGACDGGKSSDEFISIEEDDEDGMLLSKELNLGLGRNRHPDEYSETDGDEERNHAEAADGDSAGGDDHESGSGENSEEMCHAIEVEEEDVTGDHDDNSCEQNTRTEETVGGGGGSSEARRRRKASSARLPPLHPPPPSGAMAPRTRRKREATSRRPRWQ